MNLTELHKEKARLSAEISTLEADTKAKLGKLSLARGEVIRKIKLTQSTIGIAAVDLAYTVIFVRGQYDRAGDDRRGVIDDALHQIATGEKRGYRGLDHENFGTKNYASWRGQRCDCSPGCGPKHGSLVFEVGLRREVRERGGVSSLSDDQREAALYLLTHIEAIQKAEAQAQAA